MGSKERAELEEEETTETLEVESMPGQWSTNTELTCKKRHNSGIYVDFIMKANRKLLFGL